MTDGSCSSLAFAYIGNKCGLDVTDYRGGESRKIFSSNATINALANLPGVNGVVLKNYNDFKTVNQLLSLVQNDKEYYLGTGEHAAIIRKNSKTNKFEYLELQEPMQMRNKFKPLTNRVLKNRFNCKKTHTSYGTKLEATSQLIECESLGNNDEFKKILGFINTAAEKQMKGAGGNVK